MSPISLSDEVQDALRDGRPVVALESTIFSHLGLPSPANAEALERCIAAIRGAGATPAVTAVLDGQARVGLAESEHERILGPARKTAERDLPVAVAQRWPVGATTVSAALTLAAGAGLDVFATGGIGGVHRDADRSGDVSADLAALAARSLVTVCAGAKAFLDLPRTLEHLEMLSVPVIGWRSDELPAFTATTSGLAVPHRAESAAEIAETLLAARHLGLRQGILVTVPLATSEALGSDDLDAALDAALTEAEQRDLHGPEVTPFVLDRIAAATEGRSIRANLALAEANAAVAAEIAAAVATIRSAGEQR